MDRNSQETSAPREAAVLEDLVGSNATYGVPMSYEGVKYLLQRGYALIPQPGPCTEIRFSARVLSSSTIVVFPPQPVAAQTVVRLSSAAGENGWIRFFGDCLRASNRIIDRCSSDDYGGLLVYSGFLNICPGWWEFALSLASEDGRWFRCAAVKPLEHQMPAYSWSGVSSFQHDSSRDSSSIATSTKSSPFQASTPTSSSGTQQPSYADPSPPCITASPPTLPNLSFSQIPLLQHARYVPEYHTMHRTGWSLADSLGRHDCRLAMSECIASTITTLLDDLNRLISSSTGPVANATSSAGITVAPLSPQTPPPVKSLYDSDPINFKK